MYPCRLIAILGIYSMVTATADGGGLVAIFAKNAGSITLFTGGGPGHRLLRLRRYRHPQLHPLCQEQHERRVVTTSSRSSWATP